MIAKEYRRRDVISFYYGGETIASNKINQAIADALSSSEERKFVETVEVAWILKLEEFQILYGFMEAFWVLYSWSMISLRSGKIMVFIYGLYFLPLLLYSLTLLLMNIFWIKTKLCFGKLVNIWQFFVHFIFCLPLIQMMFLKIIIK